jgi:hypothetical protein
MLSKSSLAGSPEGVGGGGTGLRGVGEGGAMSLIALAISAGAGGVGIAGGIGAGGGMGADGGFITESIWAPTWGIAGMTGVTGLALAGGGTTGTCPIGFSSWPSGCIGAPG